MTNDDVATWLTANNRLSKYTNYTPPTSTQDGAAGSFPGWSWIRSRQETVHSRNSLLWRLHVHIAFLQFLTGQKYNQTLRSKWYGLSLLPYACNAAKPLCGWKNTVLLWNLHLSIYRMSQKECARLREGVPYGKVYRYNPKHLCPKLNGYGDNGQRSLKLWQLLHTCWLPNTY
jgi:hypothetical protein